MKTRALIFVLLALVLGAVAPAAAQTSQDITLELDAGYDGLFHTGSPLPVVVTVSNNGADIQGRIVIQFANQQRSTVVQEVDLPRGSRKRLHLWLQGNDFGGDAVQARLIVDDRALVIANERVTPIDESVALVAYVGENPPQALPNLRAALNRPANTISLMPAELPDLDGLLVALDMIVLGQGELTPAQIAALRRWVIAGGTLLIDGGPDVRIAENLLDLLPATPGKVIEGAALGRRDIARARRLTPLPGARSHPNAASPLWVERSFGAGVVRLSAISPEQLSSGVNGRSFWSPSRQADQLAELWAMDLPQLRPLLPGLALPSTGALALFLLVYILLIGPANYLFLRRIDRREWAWITIPTGVLLFTAFAYLLGFGLRGGNPILIDVTLVQAAPGEAAGRAVSNVGFAAVRRDNYTVEVGTPAIGWWPQREFFNVHPTEGFRQEAGGFSAVSLQANVGEIRQIQALSAVELPFSVESALQAGGTIMITNTGSTPIEEAYLVRGGQYLSLNVLQPGQTARVEAGQLRCCFPNQVAASESSLAQQIVFGSEATRFGFFSTPLPLTDQWSLVILSDRGVLPASLDRPAQRLSATIYVLYLPSGEER